MPPRLPPPLAPVFVALPPPPRKPPPRKRSLPSLPPPPANAVRILRTLLKSVLGLFKGPVDGAVGLWPGARGGGGARAGRARRGAHGVQQPRQEPQALPQRGEWLAEP
jgi:hypothetical protein